MHQFPYRLLRVFRQQRRGFPHGHPIRLGKAYEARVAPFRKLISDGWDSLGNRSNRVFEVFPHRPYVEVVSQHVILRDCLADAPFDLYEATVHDQRKRIASPTLRIQAASDRALSSLQFQGSNSSIRLLGCSAIRWSTSVSHA